MTSAGATARLDEFLAGDFERLGPAVTSRCAALAGKRLYLTGATGFFGRNLLALLSWLARSSVEFRVTALSRAPQRFLARERWCADAAWLEWRTGDVRDPWPGAGSFDLLLHAATDTHADAHRDRQAVLDDLIAGTRRALEFASTHAIGRVLLTGSGAQYGAIPPVHAAGIPESAAQACDSTLGSSAYGEGKRLAEVLAALHAERTGAAIVNTRCFAFVGPGLPLDGHFAIGNFVRDALAGRPLRLTSAGAATRSYLYSADLAVWLLTLLLEAPAGSAVNVGSDAAVTILGLATRVRDLIAPGVPLHVGSARPGEERHYYLPSIGVARAFGLDAWTSLDDAILRTAEWHRHGAHS